MSDDGPLTGIIQASRTARFWVGASSLYLSYKITQARSAVLAAAGWDAERIKKEVWDKQHEWVGERMYQMCVNLKGFYIKASQHGGCRGGEVPAARVRIGGVVLTALAWCAACMIFGVWEQLFRATGGMQLVA